MLSQEVSSRTTPTDSKYGRAIILQQSHADLSQLHQATTDNVAPEYYGSALAITFSDWHVLLGTRKLGYICSRVVS
jgi:hypothetical protein